MAETTSTALPVAEQEEWKPIPGYEGWYSASTLGRIRRDRRGVGTHAGRILKPLKGFHGYVRIFLNRHGIHRQFAVHRLVCAAFFGPCPEGYEVNHKHGIKHDNRITELEYVTRGENNRHAYQTGLTQMRHGEMAPGARLTKADVIQIRQLLKTMPVKHVADRFGVARGTVSDIKHGLTWRRV